MVIISGPYDYFKLNYYNKKKKIIREAVFCPVNKKKYRIYKKWSSLCTNQTSFVTKTIPQVDDRCDIFLIGKAENKTSQ